MNTQGENSLILRDDDIFLTGSERSGQIYDFEAFKEIHEIIAKTGREHMLAVIASEIETYPELKDYILSRKEEFGFGVHGWEHSNYTKWSSEDIKKDLLRAKEEIEKVFNVEVSWFFPPWNRTNETLIRSAKEVGLKTDINYTLPETILQGGAVGKAETLCFHYWVKRQQEELKQCLKL
jgi:peptidoglycan/xylan/chitin deacetylase (PgdA/CDA1 family)